MNQDADQTSPEAFVRAYERALASQGWLQVEPLIHNDACVTFSTGAVFKGKPAVKDAFERNFSAIESEKYSISNVYWVRRNSDYANYLFDFSWSGYINGKDAGGAGRGTCVLTNETGKWQLLIEHLGPKSP